MTPAPEMPILISEGMTSAARNDAELPRTDLLFRAEIGPRARQRKLAVLERPCDRRRRTVDHAADWNFGAIHRGMRTRASAGAAVAKIDRRISAPRAIRLIRLRHVDREAAVEDRVAGRAGHENGRCARELLLQALAVAGRVEDIDDLRLAEVRTRHVAHATRARVDLAERSPDRHRVALGDRPVR